MSKQLRLILTIGIPIILILVVAGVYYWPRIQPTDQTQTNLTKMTLALDWTPNTNHTGIYVAQKQGWYREQGIDLSILPYTDVLPDTLVSENKADIGVSSTEGVITDAAVGQPVVSIAAMLQHDTSALVSLADSGIKRPRDLDGKTYGGFGASYEEAAVRQIIQQDGGKGDFKNVTLSTGAMEALKAKKVDFVWIFDGVEGVQAEHDGLQLTRFFVKDYGVPDHYTPNLITGQTQIKEKSDLLKKFLAATARGYEYARTNPREAAQMLVDIAGKDVFPDLNYVIDSQQYQSKYYADTGKTWGIQDHDVWNAYLHFRLQQQNIVDASGKVVTDIPLEPLFSNDFLPKP